MKKPGTGLYPGVRSFPLRNAILNSLSDPLTHFQHSLFNSFFPGSCRGPGNRGARIYIVNMTEEIISNLVSGHPERDAVILKELFFVILRFQ